MPKFMAVYTGSPAKAGASPPDEETIGRGMKAWGDWMAGHAGAIVDTGGPLGKTLRVSGGGVAPHANALTGYVIVEAETHEAAAAMFEAHPHFAIFPGEAVEVMAMPPIPGQ
ncbi:hypothetical protein [Parasphingopyxis marina]|uniref:YCII-related domain-containing protein n=1 Tax=Parasphingopyxis marina TaxID=2761622 RepID=A0A842HVS1_9SPHN|nr:hypothetical protein [Parasphingopyxis marina]MBC2776593.1 hypothetical protein [Parasphingopyxis marina]